MARILVQTDDCRTVLDERDVQLADVNGEKSKGDLRDRLEVAVGDAERRPAKRRRRLTRPAVIIPVSDYRSVSG